MTDWNDFKIKPFKLENVPAELQWCIYPEEQARGEVFLPETIYRVVLALRWILTYTDSGLEDEFETWKVYWQCDDEYGFKTRIFLFRAKVEQYNQWRDEFQVVQEQTWHQLATVFCNNGYGNVNRVHSELAQPYGGRRSLNGKLGVERLLVDAAMGSQATHDTLRCEKGVYATLRTGSWRQEADSTYLHFEAVGDYPVTSLKLKVEEM